MLLKAGIRQLTDTCLKTISNPFLVRSFFKVRIFYRNVKRSRLLLNMLFILFISLIWGCQNFEMSTDGVMGDNLIMTGGDVLTQIQPYTGPEIPLLNGNGVQVGYLEVDNTRFDLTIKLNTSESFSINKVQL